MAETLALQREELVWCAAESTAGTQVDPVAGDAILPIAMCSVNQAVESLTDNQTRNSRSRFPNIRGITKAGTFSIPIDIKPSGSLGSVPDCDTLMKSLMGTQTINASTSVVYTFANSALPTFTLWRKLGHTMQVARGCVVNSASFSIAGNAIGTGTFEGLFFELAQASEDTVGVGGISDVATTLPVTNGKNFHIPSGMYIYATINSLETVKITAVSGNNLTVTRAQKGTTAVAHLAGVPITFWNPGTTETGSPVHGKSGAVTIDGSTTILLDVKIDVNNNVKVYEEEKNGLYVASSYGTPGKREVKASTKAYYRSSDNRHLADSLALTTFAMVVNLGDTAGRIVEYSAPTAIKQSPTLSGSEEAELAINWDCIAAVGSAESELTITFK